MRHSQLVGAYWITFIGNEYIEKLGGRTGFNAAPVWKIRDLPEGVMLIKHPHPYKANVEQRMEGIFEVQNFLSGLIPKEESLI